MKKTLKQVAHAAQKGILVRLPSARWAEGALQMVVGIPDLKQALMPHTDTQALLLLKFLKIPISIAAIFVLTPRFGLSS